MRVFRAQVIRRRWDNREGFGISSRSASCGGGRVMGALGAAKVLVIAVLVSFGLAACGDGDEAAGPAASPTSTSTSAPPGDSQGGSASPTSTSTSAPPRRSPGGFERGFFTGQAPIDNILKLAYAQDIDGFIANMDFRPLACEPDPVGIGSAPKCREGAVAGAPMRVFPNVGCEGGWATEAEAREALATVLTPATRFYAAFRVTKPAGVFSLGDTVVVLQGPDAPSGRSPALHQVGLGDTGKIVLMQYFCGQEASALLPESGFIIPPRSP